MIPSFQIKSISKIKLLSFYWSSQPVGSTHVLLNLKAFLLGLRHLLWYCHQIFLILLYFIIFLLYFPLNAVISVITIQNLTIILSQVAPPVQRPPIKCLKYMGTLFQEALMNWPSRFLDFFLVIANWIFYIGVLIERRGFSRGLIDFLFDVDEIFDERTFIVVICFIEFMLGMLDIIMKLIFGDCVALPHQLNCRL